MEWRGEPVGETERESERGHSALEEMAECGRKALSLLEAARSRYESLQISDDVFGESGDDSSENPFYSTSGDSNSDNYMAETGEVQRDFGDNESSHSEGCGGGGGSGSSGAGPPGSVSRSQAEEDGWTDTLQDITVPLYQDTYGETRCMTLHKHRLWLLRRRALDSLFSGQPCSLCGPDFGAKQVHKRLLLL